MYSLVIPVYKNEASIPDLLNALTELRVKLDASLEAVFVVDGSPDRCYELLKRSLHEVPFASQLVLHSRNYGALASIRTGLRAANGTYFVVMSADLQEPPELLVESFRSLRANECDVVIGARESRRDPFMSQLASRAFWWMYQRVVMPEIPSGGVDIFGCNEQFRGELLKLEESHGSLIGLLFWLGFRRKTVCYHRQPRRHGKSAWTLRKRIDYLTDSVFAFSDAPIKLLIAAGGAGLLFALCFGSFVVFLRLVGLVPIRGYAPIIIVLSFFGGLNMVGLGIIGAYVWRIYANTQRRPLSVIMRSEGFVGRRKSTDMQGNE